jgi:hypothetical protein
MPTQPLSAALSWSALPFSMSLNSIFLNLLASVYIAGPVKVK